MLKQTFNFCITEMPTAYQSYQRLVNALKNAEIYFYISLEMAFFGMRQLLKTITQSNLTKWLKYLDNCSMTNTEIERKKIYSLGLLLNI